MNLLEWEVGIPGKDGVRDLRCALGGTLTD